MQIWVDADACPQVVKEILFRAADRLHVPLVLVANKILRLPASALIRFIRVGAGPNVADNEIVGQLEKGDLVITADIPLAANVVAKGGFALDPRGNLYSKETIGERLSIRNFMDELRGSGVETGGPLPLAKGDRQAFANQLDRFLTRAMVNR